MTRHKLIKAIQVHGLTPVIHKRAYPILIAMIVTMAMWIITLMMMLMTMTMRIIALVMMMFVMMMVFRPPVSGRLMLVLMLVLVVVLVVMLMMMFIVTPFP